MTWCVSNNSACGSRYQSGTNGCTLLPITLTNFSGRLIEVNDNWRENKKLAEITWTTVNENSNNFYTLKKSQDGVIFEELVRIEGAGTTNVLKTYKEYDYTQIGRAHV